MSDQGDPLTLDQLQQYQNQQRRMQMAAMLMQGNANNNAAYGGIANAGSALLGAAMAKRMMQNQASPAAQAMVQRGQVDSLDQANSILNAQPGIVRPQPISVQATGRLAAGSLSTPPTGNLFNLGGN